MEIIQSVYGCFICFMACLNTVNGWQCPDDKVIQDKYVRSGEPAVINFQTTLINAPNLVLLYSVLNFQGYNLFIATFYNNQFQNQKTFLGSEFIGDARTGNFTVKTAAVNSTSGGMYLLRYKKGAANYSTEKCLMLYTLGKPEKATIMQDNNNILGKDSRLTCNSLSTTYPSNHTLSFIFNWKVNDVTNPTDNVKYVFSSLRNQLTIKYVSREDANTRFTCSATETGGSITGLSSDESNQLTFQVIYGPDADTTSLNPPNTQYTLNEGEALADITCSGECYPRCYYKWTKAGTTVNNRAVLSLGQLSKTMTGIYTCEVTNSNTTSISAIKKQVNVYVMFGPDASTTSLTPTTTSYTLNEGTPLSTLRCSGDCYPACNYKWTKTGNSGLTPVNNGNLSLGPLHRDEAGIYICTVSNPTSKQEQTKTVSISVIFGPDAISTSLIPSDTSYTLNEGSPLNTIRCSGDCYPACNYKWTKTGNSGFTPVNNANLSLGSLHRDKAGTYICTVSNPTTRHEQTKTVSIIVIYPPSITSFLVKGHVGKPSVILDENDEEIQIICEVDSNPASTIKILFHGKVIKAASATKNTLLTLKSVSCLDSGEYTCEGSNNIGQSSQRSMQLLVNCSPRPLHRINQNISSLPTTQVILSFTALAYPNPGAKGFSWHKENFNDWTQVLANKDLLISSTALQSNLTIQNVTKIDYGRYRLKIKNDLGIYVQYFSLTETIVDAGQPKREIMYDRCDNNDKTIITGITLGIVNAILVGYGVFITILYKRRSGNEESGIRQQKSTQKTYMNISYIANAAENQPVRIERNIERNVACSNKIPDDDNKQYTDLSEYSRDDKTAYDILSTQLL